jgi:hypothetical protein
VGQEVAPDPPGGLGPGTVTAVSSRADTTGERQAAARNAAAVVLAPETFSYVRQSGELTGMLTRVTDQSQRLQCRAVTTASAAISAISM